jgi:hypothetical protein
MKTKQILFVITTLFCVSFMTVLAVEQESSIPASKVVSGTIALEYTTTGNEIIGGFFVRLTNCIPPREEPVVVGLRVHGKLLSERIAIPAFPHPLSRWTFKGRNAQIPLDIGQEYRQAIKPIRLKSGDKVTIEVLSAPPMQSGITVGLQRQGTYRLDEMRNPFREIRDAGPVCCLPWSSEVITVGNQIKFDPECAPQNNSSIIADADGTLYQFTAYYSVDEQYGGGRGGSFSRIFGFRKSPDTKLWERLGIAVDILPGQTYAGDPFVCRDLEGTPCLFYSVVDGTNGFSDWKVNDLYLIRSKTKSFAGPWGKPHAIFRSYPREPDDNKTGGRANCARVYTREKTKDYVLLWNHGAQDMDIRGRILPNLDVTLSHEEIGNAPILVRNQEEGGGGFQFGDKGYYSTWQIPGVNDPTGIQRVYEFDLNDPLNPESWHIVPGSLGFNNGAVSHRDGGCTADAWAVSKIGNELWATSCEWSVSEQKNYLMAHQTPWKTDEKSLSYFSFSNGVFRYGVPRVKHFHQIAPVIEYAVAEECSLELTMKSEGNNAYLFLLLGPSAAPLTTSTLGLKISPDGSQLIACTNDLKNIPLTEPVQPKWEQNKEYKLKLQRRGNDLIGYVNGQIIGHVSLTGSDQLQCLQDSPRFKLYGWQGSLHTIRDAVLIDGPEN